MKTNMKRLAAAVLTCAMLLSGCGAGTDSSTGTSAPAESGSGEEKVTVTMWAWFDKEKLVPAFQEMYPNIDIEFVKFDSPSDVATKLQMAVASGGEVPDVAAVSYYDMGTMYALDIWEDLSAEPYNLDPDIFVPSLLPEMLDPEGRLVGICEKPGTTGIGYKRELAKEYFGTDDPDELEAMFDSWDAFIEKGKEVRDKSNGTVYMFPTVSEVFKLVYWSGDEGYIEGDALNLEATREAFEVVLEMKKEGLIDTMEWEGPAHDSSLLQQNHIFGMMPMYFPTFKIKQIDKDHTVQWGLMSPPGGAVCDGSNAWAIPKGAKNKDAAFKWVQWFAASDEGTQAVRDIWPTFSPLQKRYEEPGFYSMEDEWFGGQDVFAKFAEMTVESQNKSPEYNKYVSTVQGQIDIALTTINASKDGTDIDLDQLLADVEEQIRIAEPDMK